MRISSAWERSQSSRYAMESLRSSGQATEGSILSAKLWHSLDPRLQLHYSGYLGRLTWVSWTDSKFARNESIANHLSSTFIGPLTKFVHLSTPCCLVIFSNRYQRRLRRCNLCLHFRVGRYICQFYRVVGISLYVCCYYIQVDLMLDLLLTTT